MKALRARLRAGETSVGSWMQLPHASVAEIMGQAGYDWVALDLEHGAIDVSQMPDLCRALELGGTLPLARVAQGHPKDCKRALEAGAGGLIIPMIESAAELTAAIAGCRWPPAGTRGVGFSRANLFGKHFDEYAKEAQAPFLVAMIENQRAVQDLPAIVAVDGLDALLIGPYDLSASIGRTAQFTHPEFEAQMSRIREVTAAAGMPCGVHVVQPSPDELRARRDAGFRFLAYSIDSVMLNHAALRPTL